MLGVTVQIRPTCWADLRAWANRYEVLPVSMIWPANVNLSLIAALISIPDTNKPRRTALRAGLCVDVRHRVALHVEVAGADPTSTRWRS